MQWPVTRFRLLAGLQAGVVGGLAMLCFYSFASTLQRQPWWSSANLLGSAVYGNAAFWKGLSRVTLAGAGLEIVLSGIAGMICAFLLPPFRGHGLVQFLVAIATAMLWYLCQYQLIFPTLAPLIPAYSVRNLPVVAHLLLGIALTRIPALYEELVRHFLNQPTSATGTPVLPTPPIVY
ncbi:hypothetical protein F183_A47930 [Bryobacterales bacterium F-183]|nr:hypothetical protein F183_A47930 [Bryobacterales bacterium F-183]